MCGIAAHLSFKNKQTSDSLTEMLLQLQHRGQDGWGIASANPDRIFDGRAIGLLKDGLDREMLMKFPGTMSIGQVRYATQGSKKNPNYTQPFVITQPCAMALVHNGNITNTSSLKRTYGESCQTQSDSEALLHVISALVENQQSEDVKEKLFGAVQELMAIVQGAYSVVLMVQGKGILAFRDPRATRPLCFGQSEEGVTFSSESCAIVPLSQEYHLRDLGPGEALWVGLSGEIESRTLKQGTLQPCAFEYIYLARKASIIDGVSVHRSRVNMGVELANHLQEVIPDYKDRFDRVISVPETADSCAAKMARELGLDYRTGFDKNRFIGRSFMQPSQEERERAVWRKLQPIEENLAGYRILVVDDSLVRGTTSKQLVYMLREAGAKEVHMVSASPAVRYSNYYGIDLASQEELIAYNRSDQDVAQAIGADSMMYLPLEKMTRAILKEHTKIESLETSCFDGEYPMGTPDYLAA